MVKGEESCKHLMSKLKHARMAIIAIASSLINRLIYGKQAYIF